MVLLNLFFLFFGSLLLLHPTTFIKMITGILNVWEMYCLGFIDFSGYFRPMVDVLDLKNLIL